ncbi:hypothetical protein G7Y89_g1444 [Cudoniella acicularis]|uniref:Uncharacterized protein n=1 Tax=Cudoniella acicularis TaxID=354080 RepID=A0A8H4RW24_9HELO|nr:hypothetical protein G7Y89_g1444 [Cudoniella acicularis]
MVSIKHIVLFAAGVAALTIQKRDFNKALTDLQTLDSNVNAFNTLVSGYQGGASYALSIYNQQTALDGQVNQCNSDAQAALTGGTINSDQFNQLQTIVNTLSTDLQIALSTLKSKKLYFLLDSVINVLQLALTTFASDTNNLSTNLVALCPAEDQAEAAAQQAAINGYFTDCINWFSN